MRTLGRQLLALLVAATTATGCLGAGVLWDEVAQHGATPTACPVGDCTPILMAARRNLAVDDPGHAAIVRQVLGVPACERDGSGCAFLGPIGVSERFAVANLLADGRTVVTLVGCGHPLKPGMWENRLPWNGMWC